MKKYNVSYTSGATGYGWDEDCDTIEEVQNLIYDIRHVHTAKISVFDNIIDDFIFYKHALSHPSVDMIYCYNRDLRTSTRKCKY